VTVSFNEKLKKKYSYLWSPENMGKKIEIRRTASLSIPGNALLDPE